PSYRCTHHSPHPAHPLAAAIDRPGTLTRTLLPFSSKFSATSSRKLFKISTTNPPPPVTNHIARTPFTAPEVSTRTAPGRTNLLKCAKYQYVPVYVTSCVVLLMITTGC